MPAVENIKAFVRSVLDGRATVFIGAGVSQEVGLPGWNELAGRFMEVIGTGPDVETDPLRLAEYVKLSSNDGRTRLLSCLSEELDENSHPSNPEAIKILSELPIDSLWTTNFDTIIERTFGARNRELRSLTSHQCLLERTEGKSRCTRYTAASNASGGMGQTASSSLAPTTTGLPNHVEAFRPDGNPILSRNTSFPLASTLQIQTYTTSSRLPRQRSKLRSRGIS
jgi:hypothetical protein